MVNAQCTLPLFKTLKQAQTAQRIKNRPTLENSIIPTRPKKFDMIDQRRRAELKRRKVGLGSVFKQRRWFKIRIR
jgi:hypothetical protein